MIVFFFLYNSNYSPQLLTYQCGNELAKKIKGKIAADDIYLWKTDFSSSFNFYTSTLRKEFSDSLLKSNKNIWLLFDKRDEADIFQSGYSIEKAIEVPDYEVSKAQLKFLNPATRQKVLKRVLIGRISRQQ